MERKTYTLNDGREINFRPLQPTDREQLIQFYRSMSENALRWTNPPTDKEIDQKIRFSDYFVSLVTEHDKKVIGYGEIQKDSRRLDGELNIHIHQDYQGVGLGTTMMIMLMKDATDQKLHKINLKVAAENRRAVHLFMKFGFQEQKTTKETYSNKEHNTIFMSKALTL
ncbi:GNAT family N-acetyltransferase [Thermoproteota archaeon]